MSQSTRIGATIGASLMLALSACSDAQADSWTGRDKQMHLAAGAAVAMPVTLITRDVSHGSISGPCRRPHRARHAVAVALLALIAWGVIA